MRTGGEDSLIVRRHSPLATEGIDAAGQPQSGGFTGIDGTGIITTGGPVANRPQALIRK